MTGHTATLTEVADILAKHGTLRCMPSVEANARGEFELTVRLTPEDQQTNGEAFETAEWFQEMRYLAGLAQVRAFASTYGIDAEALERVIVGPDKEV